MAEAVTDTLTIFDLLLVAVKTKSDIQCTRCKEVGGASEFALTKNDEPPLFCWKNELCAASDGAGKYVFLLPLKSIPFEKRREFSVLPKDILCSGCKTKLREEMISAIKATATNCPRCREKYPTIWAITAEISQDHQLPDA